MGLGEGALLPFDQVSRWSENTFGVSGRGRTGELPCFMYIQLLSFYIE